MNEAAKVRVCSEVIRIMRMHDEQTRRGYVDSPGGLEHMGDVWRMLGRWRDQLVTDAEPGRVFFGMAPPARNHEEPRMDPQTVVDLLNEQARAAPAGPQRAIWEDAAKCVAALIKSAAERRPPT